MVHGAFHGAWCWQMVTEHLNLHGVTAIALDLPGRGGKHGMGDSLAECALHLHETIVGCDGPVIVCGHSLGGATITEVADPAEQIRHLVYLAALIPDVGESAVDCAPELLTGEVGGASHLDDDGMIAIDPEIARSVFYHDCDLNIADWAVAHLCSQNPTVAMTPISRASWHKCESSYVVCEQDRALPVTAQERLATRCDNVVRWQTSHSPMLSQPQVVGDFFIELAKSTTR